MLMLLFQTKTSLIDDLIYEKLFHNLFPIQTDDAQYMHNKVDKLPRIKLIHSNLPKFNMQLYIVELLPASYFYLLF